MGIGSWLLGLGVQAEGLAAQVATRTGALPLEWPKGPPGSVIHRLTRDPHQRASLFATEQTIVVNEGELAVVLEDGISRGALAAGRYVFKKARVVGALDILWVRTAQQAIKWGIGNVTSLDGIQLGGNGVAYLRVEDGVAFNAEVVQGAVVLAESDLQRMLLPRLQGVLRSTLAKWPALELQSQRELFSEAVQHALAETFGKLGLAVVGFEVVEIAFPPEFKAAIAQAALAGHEGRAKLVEAQARAQIAQLDAGASAQAQLTSGMVQVQLMAQMQQLGIDPLKLKAIEAVSLLAANPGGGAMFGDPRASVVGQVAFAALSAPAAPPVPAAPASAPLAAAAPAPPPDTRAELERQLDALTQRLADGQLSEELYQKLAARLEARLAGLLSG